MIGVFALAGWEPSQLTVHVRNVAMKMATNPSWDVTTGVYDDVACGRVGQKRPDAAWTSADGQQRAWLDGFALTLSPDGSRHDRRVGAGEMARALVSGGPPALSGFQGEFLLLVLDAPKRRLLVATDRFGTRTAYCHAAAGRLALASELRPLLQLGLVPRELDKLSLAALLRFNKCRLGDRTIFAGITVLPPGTVLEYSLDRLDRPMSHIYYRHDLHHEPKSQGEWVEEIVPALSDAANLTVCAGGDTSSVALSGGLDSRLLLAALDEERRKRVFFISCGMPESDEVALAARASACVGADYRNVDLGPSDFLAWAQAGVQRNEEFDIFVQGAQGALHQAALQVGTSLSSGWDLDVPLRGTYLSESSLGLTDFSQVRCLIGTRWGLFSRSEMAGLLQERFYRDVEGEVEEWLDETVATLPGETPLLRYLQFIFQYEKRRLLMLRNRMVRFELETTTPFYNTRLQLLLARIPESLKAEDRMFAQVFLRLAPQLAEIPYQRTMLPPNVPVEYWSRGAALEDRRESLYREVFTNTGIRIPYQRYYSNFDEWLASDADWEESYSDLLQSDQTLLTQDFVRPEAISQIMERHRTGPTSQHSKLIYLMSLELYLREYFN